MLQRLVVNEAGPFVVASANIMAWPDKKAYCLSYNDNF
jgi:hypothetical protein